MSQRLRIGKTNDIGFDCVIDTESGSFDKIRKKWIGSRGGPWKIRIESIPLWRNIEPQIKKLLEDVGFSYPIDVWFFYYRETSLEHPSKDELRNWLEKSEKESALVDNPQ